MNLFVCKAISSTFGNLLSITFAAAMIFSSISSTFIPVWPIRAVLKEEKDNLYMWANKFISSCLFSLGIPRNAKSPVICNYLNVHKGWMAIAEIFCDNRIDSSFHIWICNFCVTLQSITNNLDPFRYTIHEKNLIRMEYFGNRKILLN